MQDTCRIHAGYMRDECICSEDVDERLPTHLHRYIAGPATTTFPNPEGWTTVQPSKTITSLAHLTIQNITQHYTEPHIRNLRPPVVCEGVGAEVHDASASLLLR